MDNSVPKKIKRDLSERVAARTGTGTKEAAKWVSEVVEVLGDMMMEADPEVKIEIRGLGVFEVKRTRPRPKARNPRTNEIVPVPSRRKTRFRPSKRIRKEMQKPLEEVAGGRGA